jgi:hypothetical protein
MEKVKSDPQVSTNGNTIKYLKKTHYIETVNIAQTVKVGSLHAYQKWSLRWKNKFFC